MCVAPHAAELKRGIPRTKALAKAAEAPQKSFYVCRPKPPGCKTVFVGNLAFNVTAAQVPN
jgi:RNA recognition motif-containing protein